MSGVSSTLSADTTVKMIMSSANAIALAVITKKWVDAVKSNADSNAKQCSMPIRAVPPETKGADSRLGSRILQNLVSDSKSQRQAVPVEIPETRNI